MSQINSRLGAGHDIVFLQSDMAKKRDDGTRVIAENRKARFAYAISDTLAWVQYKKGSYDSARELLRECVQKVPDKGQYRHR